MVRHIISYSFFYTPAADPKRRWEIERTYLLGLLKNYQRARKLLPGFVTRVYYDCSVGPRAAAALQAVAAIQSDFEAVLEHIPELEALGAATGHANLAGTLLRFLALEEEGTCVVIRDCDRLLSNTDASFLLGWTRDRKRAGLFRYFSHEYGWPLMGGLFACCRPVPVRALLRDAFGAVRTEERHSAAEYFVDQKFLRDFVWPRFAEQDVWTVPISLSRSEARSLAQTIHLHRLALTHSPKGHPLHRWEQWAAELAKRHAWRLKKKKREREGERNRLLLSDL